MKNFVDSTVGHVRSLLWLLLGAVSIVLLIACGNAANLLLARAASRMRELGVRVALGAGRSRIIRQLLTEALLIGVAAGAIGIGLAFAFLRLLPLLDPGNIPRLREASLDMRVLLFTVAVSLLTSVLTGILPALAVSRINLTDFLATTGSRSVAGAHTRVQSASHRRRIRAGRGAAGLGRPAHSQLHQRRIGRHRLLAIHRHSEHWARSALWPPTAQLNSSEISSRGCKRCPA